MFRSIISPSSGATFNNLYAQLVHTGTSGCQTYRHVPIALYSSLNVAIDDGLMIHRNTQSHLMKNKGYLQESVHLVVLYTHSLLLISVRVDITATECVHKEQIAWKLPKDPAGNQTHNIQRCSTSRNSATLSPQMGSTRHSNSADPVSNFHLLTSGRFFFILHVEPIKFVHTTSNMPRRLSSTYEGRAESHEQLFFCTRTGNSRRSRVRW